MIPKLQTEADKGKGELPMEREQRREEWQVLAVHSHCHLVVVCSLSSCFSFAFLCLCYQSYIHITDAVFKKTHYTALNIKHANFDSSDSWQQHCTIFFLPLFDRAKNDVTVSAVIYAHCCWVIEYIDVTLLWERKLLLLVLISMIIRVSLWLNIKYHCN